VGGNLLRRVLVMCAALFLIGAGGAFAYAIQANHMTSVQLAAETHRHCLIDASQNNRARTLDLTLIAADRQVLARLAVLMPHADATGRAIIAIQSDYYRQALAGRFAHLPPYDNPAHC
jgi:hypothetical protein